MDDETTSFVFFDGRFWIALVERRRGGKLFIARHVFGAEPANPELRDFYLHRLPFLSFLKAPKDYRPPKAERLPAAGSAPSSLERFKEAVRQRAEESKARRGERHKRDVEEAFAMRREKRRRKSRGH